MPSTLPASPLRMLVDLRNVVDAALTRTAKKATSAEPSKPPALRARAAAAGAQFATVQLPMWLSSKLTRLQRSDDDSTMTAQQQSEDDE